MRRTLAALIACGLCLTASALEQYSASGTATDAATTLTVVDKRGDRMRPFGIVVANRGTTNELWVRLDGVTATAAAPAVELRAGERLTISCDTLRDNCPTRISLICSAAETTAYQVDAVR